MKLTGKIVSVNAARPEAAILGRAARIIRNGGVVVFPTHGLYGLGADPLNTAAVERIFAIKGRQAHKALLVLIADLASLERVAERPNAQAQELMRHFWPGRVTIVLRARPELPAAVTGSDGTIGVRLVAHPVAAALVRAFGGPITGTSANISGSGGCARLEAMDAGLLDGVDLTLDAGPLAGGPGSTVVDATGRTLRILREGAVPSEEIRRVWGATLC